MKKIINQKRLRDLELRNLHQKKNKTQGPLLGIDYGMKFCGLAFSPDGVCVFPLEVVKLAEINSRLKIIVSSKKIEKIVIGFPLSPNAQENQVCKDIRDFTKLIQFWFKKDIVFQDEKFSTQEGLKLKTKKESRADHLAAAKILEYFLEK